MLSTGGEFLLAAPVTQKTVMPDLHKPVRQHMKQEAPDELVDINGHNLGFVVVGIVAPPEGDLVVLYSYNPMIADRDPVGISAEILKNAFCPIKGRFAVNDPVLIV